MPTDVTYIVVADTHIGVHVPTQNYGSSTASLGIGQDAIPDHVWRTLLRFDISNVADPAQIESARLRLRHHFGSVTIAPLCYAYVLNVPGWTEIGATWLVYNGSDEWPGGPGGAGDVGVGVSFVPPLTGDWFEVLGFGAICQAAHANSGGIVNLLFKSDLENYNEFTTLRPREWSGGAGAAQLILTMADVAPIEDFLVRDDLRLNRLHPYDCVPVAKTCGWWPHVDDPYGPPVLHIRWAHRSQASFCYNVQPPASDIAAPCAGQVGRIWLKQFRDEQTQAVLGPPRLTTGWYHPLSGRCEVFFPETLDNCLGTAFDNEKARWITGGIGLEQDRAGSDIVGPPIWKAWHIYTNLPPQQGEYLNRDYGDRIAAMWEAQQYRHAVLYPVPPFDSWVGEPGYPENVPYEPGAHNDFVFDDTDTGTYEVPCYKRESDWRYIDPRGPVPPATVPAGLRAIVAQSDHPEPRMALLAHYSFGGCAEGGPPFWPMGMVENFIRLYRGTTATVRHVWDDDPEERGWWVEYRATIEIRFVHNFKYQTSYSDCIRPCWVRWNTWYTGKVTAKINGDLSVGAFKAWIGNHDSGFGTTWEPDYDLCNDCFAGCLGEQQSMGDVSAPQESIQDYCVLQDGTTPTPCRQQGMYSKWYVPEPPIEIPLLASSHPITEVPQYPEVGLLHRFVRRKFDENGQPVGINYGWATLAFTTDTPMLIST